MASTLEPVAALSEMLRACWCCESGMWCTGVSSTNTDKIIQDLMQSHSPTHWLRWGSTHIKPWWQLVFCDRSTSQSDNTLSFDIISYHIISFASSQRPRLTGDSGNLQVSYFGHPCYGRPGDKSLRHACVYKCSLAEDDGRNRLEDEHIWCKANNFWGQMLGSPCEDDAVVSQLRWK